MRCAAPILLLVGLLGSASAASAQTAPAPTHGPVFRAAPDVPAPPPREIVRLEYAAPAGCPDEQALRTSLAARLGYDPVSSAAPRLLRVSLSRAASGFSVKAELRDATGRAVWSRPPLADADCRALVDVISLSLKFAIDPDSTALAPAPVVLEAPAAPPPPPSAPGPDRAQPPAPLPSARPRFRLGIRAGGSIGTAPSPTATFAADIGAGWEHFSIAVEGRADLPATGTVLMNVQLQTRIAAASLVPCGHYRWFFGCALVSVGGLWAQGTSPPHAAAGSAIYAVAGPRAGLEWPIPSLPAVALRLSTDVLVTVHPITVRVMGTNAWPVPPFAGQLGGGLVLRL